METQILNAAGVQETVLSSAQGFARPPPNKIVKRATEKAVRLCPGAEPEELPDAASA